MAATYKQWIYAKRPAAEVSEEHYELKEVAIPTESDLGEGQLLVKYELWSVDPYMRIQQAASNTWEAPHPLGKVQGGGAVGKVLISKSAKVPVGTFVNSYTGWTEYSVVGEDDVTVLDPEQADVSFSLSVLGMPGRTAFFGLLEAGKPREGETVVVSGAAGAVGSIVSQIAKIKGCRVVGIAGKPEKLTFLTEELGLDAAINYKTHDNAQKMAAALKEACPNGIDVYFDNVGGMITDAVMTQLALRARVIICGQITQYSGNLDAPNVGPRFLHHILYKRATIQGILARDYTPRHGEMVAEVSRWIKEGKVKYRQTFEEGFDNLPRALSMLFVGRNTGKLIVRASA